jgi:hypothetical protein
MNELKWGEFEFWSDLYKERQRTIEGPFMSEPLTEESVFLWTQLGAPLPSGATAGEWDWFPNSKALAGFLRFIAFPVYFEIWLVREEWDPQPELFIPAEELFSLAEQSDKCRYIQDVPLMKKFIDSLDSLFALPEDQLKVELGDIAQEFNSHWENTPTWTFKIQIFETPTKVGQEILYRIFDKDEEDEDYIRDEFGMSKAEWLHICQNVLLDKELQNEFLKVLGENAWY